MLLEKQAENHISFENDGRFVINHSNDSLQSLFESIPKSIKTGMKHSVKQLSLRELQEDINKNLQSKVAVTSLSMFASGLYSTSPLKGAGYLFSKLSKAIVSEN